MLRPDASGRFPALVAASPYPRQIQNSGIPIGFVEAGTSSFFVPRGYAHVIANVRGTGGSGGEYAFFGANDRADMHDLVEWTAAQPWCDGHVGMVGISAFAMAQLAAAVEAPAHLKAIFPLAATSGASWLRPARALQEVSEGSSPRQGNSRTSCLNLTLLAGATLAARGAARFAYHFEGAAPSGCFELPTGPARASKQYRNPIALAQEWQRALDDGSARRGPPSRASSGPPGRG